ncbi:hypothetical protein GCM10029963_58150 [Micromonospora andamanensis]
MVAGLAATGAGIAVPLVAQQVVDGPVARRDLTGLFVLAGLALLLGLAEALLIFIRRWVQSSSSVAMEAAIRTDVYAHLQQLSASFHDRWPSGQLLSRITSDLSVLRRFLSFGLFFLILNVVTYLVVVVLLIRLHAALGLLVAASAVPLFLIARRFGRHYHVASRRMQDQQGDVATLVEETAQGLRTMKAYGRGPQLAARFAVGTKALHDTGIGKGRLLARTSALLDLVPNLTLGMVLVAGAAAVADDRLTIGQLVAFVSLQLMLIWPVQSLGWIIANGQEAATAADRIQEVLDTRPAIVDPPVAVALARATVRGRLRFEGVAFRYPGAPSRCCAASTSPSSPARPLPWWVPPAAARAPCCPWYPGCTTSVPAASPSTGTICVTCGWLRCAAWSGSPSRSRPCSPCRCGRTSPWADPTPVRTRSGPPWRWPRRSSRTTCRGVCEPGSGSRACRFPAASGNDSPWPGRC